MSEARREIRSAELEAMFRLAKRFPDLTQVEAQLDGFAREKAELEERVRVLSEPRLLAAEAAQSQVRAALNQRMISHELRVRTFGEARTLHKDGVITKPELRRMLGYPAETDEEIDAQDAEERRPPRHVVPRMMWGTAWRLAPVLAGPGLWPYPSPFVKDLLWGLLASILVVTGLAGVRWRRLGLAGSLWRIGLATLLVGVAWQLGLKALLAAAIAGGIICIGDVFARVVLEEA